MEPHLEILDAALTKLIQQIPALIALIWITAKFLSTMATRDQEFLRAQTKINHEMHDLAEMIRDLCEQVKVKNHDACKFHEEFQQSLNRIEQNTNKG